jgi:hypothetical protein
MKRENRVPTRKVYLSLSISAADVLARLGDLGILGKNETEVATWIVKDWIWRNQKDLAAQGIPLRQPEASKDHSTEKA